MERADGTSSGSNGNGRAARVELRLTSEPEQISAVRRAVESLCSDEGFADCDACDVGLCVNEALANVIRHAYDHEPGRPIVVSAAVIEGMVEVRIRDWGNGINPAALPPKPHDPLTPGGLGLICLRRCMSSVRFEPQADGGMLLVMTRAKSPAQGAKEQPAQGAERSGQ